MSTRDIETIAKVWTTGVIVAVVIGSLFGLVLCIGTIMVIICIVKNCNRSSHSSTRGMVLQQPYPHPHSLSAQYPSNITSVANYPPPYQSAPPPYSASAPEYPKQSYT